MIQLGLLWKIEWKFKTIQGDFKFRGGNVTYEYEAISK